MEANLRKIQTILEESDIKYDAIELAEAIWLSQYISASQKTIAKKEKTELKSEEKKSHEPIPKKQLPKETVTQAQKVKKIMIETEVTGEVSVNASTKQTKKSGLPVNIRQIKSDILNQTALYNALKYFRQTKLSNTHFTLDVEKIVDIIADTELFIPYYKQEYENKYNLIIVRDNSDTMQLWREELDYFIKSLQIFNLFKSIGEIQLDTTQKEPDFSKTIQMQDDTLFMIISDMTQKAWRSGELVQKLYRWQQKATIFVLQMFPSYLWNRTVLNDAELVRFKSNRHRKFNRTLQSDVDDMLEFLDSEFKNRALLKLPVATLELNSLEALSKVVTGQPKSSINGAIFYVDQEEKESKEKLSDTQRILRFYENSSKISHKLAHYLSVVPLDINVMKIVQKFLVPESSKIHLAEIFTSGLIKKENELYQFYHTQKDRDGIREILLNQIGTLKYKHTIEVLSNYIENNLDTGFSSLFQAILKDSETTQKGVLNKLDTEFAKINIKRLKRLGGKFEKIAKRLIMEMEAIIPTSKRFQMGSNDDGNKDEKPVHEVIINYDFEIAKYPVTFEEYDLFCEDTGREKPDDEGWGRGRRPVINVSWHDAKAYCKWLSEKTGETYRLPTEAEWEYVCRAGTTTKWSFGDDEEELEKYAWYDKNSGDKTHPAGRKLPNPWGLYDMHGNVWEWCEDWYIDNYKETTIDGSANKKGEQEYKALRGGSWISSANSSRSADRYRDYPDNRDHIFGFRLLRTLPSDNLNLINISAKDLEESDVSQPAGDVTYRCNKCHTKYALDCDELEWEEVGSHARQMGSEIHYEAYYDRECDNCGNNMGLTFNCWEYPVGAENDRDVQGNGVEEIEGDCCLDLQEQEEEQFDYDVPDDMEYEEDENESKYNESDSIEYAEEAIEEIKEWFFEHYEDPANSSLPYNSKEGGYQWIHGEPVDTAEVIYENFEKRYSEDILEKAIDEIGRHELWSPIPQSEEEFQEALGKWAKKKADDDKD